MRAGDRTIRVVNSPPARPDPNSGVARILADLRRGKSPFIPGLTFTRKTGNDSRMNPTYLNPGILEEHPDDASAIAINRNRVLPVPWTPEDIILWSDACPAWLYDAAEGTKMTVLSIPVKLLRATS